MNSHLAPLFAIAVALGGCATAQPGATPAGTTLAESRAAAAPAPTPVKPSIPTIPQYASAAQALDAELRKALGGASPEAALSRRDGYLYGQDVAALLLYAARRNDAELYGKLVPVALKLVQQNPDDPYTAGFVLWRAKAGQKPGSSGAAEALWMARALWTGAASFKRDEDRKLALAVLDGYAKHAYVLQGVWLARRGFDFSRRTFANLSTLPAYQPDFLAEAERSGGGKDWRGFAERSYALLERAATPSHLLLPVIQPEVGANYPGAGLEVYAPNGIAPLEDSCLGAEGAARGLPNLAAGLLDFAVAHAGKAGGRLSAFYSVEDGLAAGDAPLSAGGYACLSRLASARGHAEALAVLDPRLLSEMQSAARNRSFATAGSLLLAAYAREAF